jgi:hypothetical protein
MAVGRISGPLLKANLVRNGVPLAFETDLLYLDVVEQRIGVKTTLPQYELDVNGTTQTTNLRVTNNADIADVNVNGNTISTTTQYLNLATLDTVVALNKLRIDSIDIEGNAITTNSSNANLEFRPNGTGEVNVHSNLNVDGNIYATGNITADGNINIGDTNTDNVIFNAEVASDIIPDVTNTYTLGSDPTAGGKEWNDVWVNTLTASSITANDLDLGGVDLTFRNGNVYYVAANGDDANSGDHVLDPFGTIAYALSQATAGDVVRVSPGVYEEVFPLTIPQGVTLRGEGIRGVTVRPTVGTNTNDAVLLNGGATVEDLTIIGFYSPGYAFKFAPNYISGTRSPYIKNVSVITSGSVVTIEDPRGFNAGDAGKGAFIDGSVANASSATTSMLFHSATFITPGVDAITATNGARIEWLNCFTYFANRGMYAYDSPQGQRNAGKTRLTLAGVTGTFTPGNTLTITSADASTVLTGTISSVDGNDVYVNGYLDLFGFDLTPQSITDGSATATSITYYDLREFGAEIRMIGSAAIYGNFGLVGDGPGVLMYAIGQNLAYIGNGKEVTNDPSTVIQDNEVTEATGAQIRYNSVDHKGDFRVGDLFYVNQETGSVTFTVTNFNIDTQNGVTFTTGGDTTFIDGTKIETGDWRISGNTIETLTQDANFTAASGEINLNSNVNVNGSLDVSGNVTIGGNITIGDEATDTIQIIAGIDSDIKPKTASTYNLGSANKTWKNLYINEVVVDDIEIRDNYITTTLSNSDLELRANSTGRIYIPTNNVQIDNDLTVSSATDLQATTITGTVAHTGNVVQTGNINLTGNFDVTGTTTISSVAQFEEVNITNNVITTTTSNADLELRASGTGIILIPTNDVQIVNNLTVDNDITAINLTTTGLITANSFTTGNVVIDDNFIETTQSNSDLDLRANGTGRIYVPSNNVVFDNDIQVYGTTNLSNIEIQGDTAQTGNTVQTGNIDLTGDFDITGNITISSTAQFENIKIEDNIITTTESNSDLELRATIYGDIVIPANDVVISNDLYVTGTISVGNINSIGTITANSFTTGDILIDDNVIKTTTSNSDLELRANGTGEVIVPSNDVVITQNLTVDGNTFLKDTTINGTLNHIGNVTQVGDFNLTGNLDVTGEVIISASVIQFEEIQLSGNTITTTTSNADLELRANGTGTIFVPRNDVVISNNLTVDGTITVGNITSTNRITANTFSTGDILIDDNFITTTISNSNLELRAAGTGSVIIDTFDINGSTISTSGDFNITPANGLVNINATGGLKLPAGTTLERPADETGYVRFNTDLNRYEGYNGTNWVNLKGVEDLDGNTRITAELTEGLNDNIIRFYVDGVQIVDINATRLNAPQIIVDDVTIDGNVITTNNGNKNLSLTANGAGSVTFDNFAFKDNTITNTVADSITTFTNTGNGYVKFDGTYGIVIPVGSTGTRPIFDFTELGQLRYNTDDQRVEIWNGNNWVSVAGASSGITFGDAEEIALATVLVLG